MSSTTCLANQICQYSPLLIGTKRILIALASSIFICFFVMELRRYSQIVQLAKHVDGFVFGRAAQGFLGHVRSKRHVKVDLGLMRQGVEGELSAFVEKGADAFQLQKGAWLIRFHDLRIP